jgi:hypothetical protein
LQGEASSSTNTSKLEKSAGSQGDRLLHMAARQGASSGGDRDAMRTDNEVEYATPITYDEFLISLNLQVCMDGKNSFMM